MTGHFGLRGHVKVAAADGEALAPGLEVRVRSREGDRRFTLLSIRPHGRAFVIALEGVDSVEAARQLHGSDLLAPRAQLPKLRAHSYRAADLVGLAVYDERLGRLGAVESVRHYPSCDMLVVGPKALLVPMLKAFDLRVDLRAREIRVNLPPGFEEL